MTCIVIVGLGIGVFAMGQCCDGDMDVCLDMDVNCFPWCAIRVAAFAALAYAKLVLCY